MQGSAVDGEPLAQADQPAAVAGARPTAPGAPPVSVTSTRSWSAPYSTSDRRGRAGRVLDRVGQRLLDHPVGGQLDAGRQRTRLPGHGQLDRHPGVAHPLHQRVQPVEARLRRQVGVAGRVGAVAVHGEQAHDVAQLGHRRPAAGLDREQRLAGLVGRRRP